MRTIAQMNDAADAPAIGGPYPSRKAGQTLRERIIAFLVQADPPVGSRFLTDAQIARQSGLSYNTVRRALQHLHRQGWLDRRVGSGTFVGSRVGMPVISQTAIHDRRRSHTRVAVMTSEGTSGPSWWLHRAVLDGVEDAAVEQRYSVELLTGHGNDILNLQRRIQQGRPDALISIMTNRAVHCILGVAMNLGIPLLSTVSSRTGLGVPVVREDAVQGIRLATNHLAALGHRRIGMALLVVDEPTCSFIHERRRGYLEALTALGTEADESLIHWVDLALPLEQRAAAMWHYLRRQKPTAMLCSNYNTAEPLGCLIRDGKIDVPQKLSVVVYDQEAEVARWWGMTPTHVALPLRQIGRLAGEYARRLAEGLAVPELTQLPCELIEGQSTARRGGRKQ